MQARRLAEDVSSSLRLERLQQQAVDAVVSSKGAQGGEDDEGGQAPSVINFILKVCVTPRRVNHTPAAAWLQQAQRAMHRIGCSSRL